MTAKAHVALVTGVEDAITDACVRQLEAAGFEVLDDQPVTRKIDALVFNPGLYDDTAAGPDPSQQAQRLRHLVDAHRQQLTSAEGGSVVAVSARDWLGAAPRIELAAAAGALVATARSLALAMAPAGVTVNTVLPGFRGTLPTDGARTEPRQLTSHEITSADIANAVAFFANPRSRYITGQMFYVDGGSSLLSSLSV
ncbi:SDR family oxidoreductase [Streptomyces sp. NPDC051217]|uniref:SDR family oxidoreductase n=1 Tax=Streptomyces sp. NPDC051217 TaxID=3365644 RepID=UPI0037A62A22